MKTTCSILDFDLCYRSVQITAPDGVGVAAQDWGRSGSGRDVLLVHGFSQSHLCWLKQVASPLADGFRFVTYDNRGHGMSEKPLDPAFYREPERWAGEVDSVIRRLDLDKPVIVAWSYAGRIALDYLSVLGEAGISGLVMVSATSATAPEMAGPAAALLREMAEPELAPSIEAARRFTRACFASPPPEEEIEVMLSASAMTPPAVRAALGGRPAEYGDVLRRLRRPTLVIHGAEDRVVMPATGRYTAGMVRDARLLVYDGTGHAPFWEAPDRFNADLGAFLRELG